MIVTAIQSCSAPLCHAASFGAVLRAGRTVISATADQQHRDLRGAGHCSFSVLAGSQSSGGEEEMQQDLGKGSGLGLAL